MHAGPAACVASSNVAGGYRTSSLSQGVLLTSDNACCTAKLFIVALARMLFGLKSNPVTFQRATDGIVVSVK